MISRNGLGCVLVTGGAGFIGSHVCGRLLQHGYRVVSYDNFNAFYDRKIKEDNIRAVKERDAHGNFTSVVGDIRDKTGLFGLLQRERPLGVIHLAAMAGVRPSLQEPLYYTDANIVGTQVLLEACAAMKIRHLLFASSSSVYGNNPKVPFAETDCVDYPISPYAATKKAGELLCHSYYHHFAMRIACLRFFTVYGPRQRPDLAIHKFAKLILDGQEIPVFGDGESRRDYTYIDDCVSGILGALRWLTEAKQTLPVYEIVNLGESRMVSLAEMIDCLERVLGKKARIRRLPHQPGDVERTYADISKARRLFGYFPVTDFETGIEHFVDWLLSRRKAGVVAA
ncbi:MAG: GDP-mannose 4,6-dehydratase [Candidatus Omnitrophota bacterium]